MTYKVAMVALLGGASGASATAALHYQTGQISLLSGKATLDTGPGLRYLGAEDARTVITDLWGNPPGAAEDVLGMVVPAGLDPDTGAGWGVVLTESLDGHVSDKDASAINYSKMLREMQQATRERNAEREKAGYGSINLVGWAEAPHYDAASHKLYWAKELAFGSSGEPAVSSLNYAVRVLGRDSVLELNAVAGMDQLPLVRRDMVNVLQRVSFTAGHRYEDYQPGSDKLATYGVAALIGGVAAKKVGLLGVGLLFLKKGWVLLLALFGGLGRLFRRRET